MEDIMSALEFDDFEGAEPDDSFALDNKEVVKTLNEERAERRYLVEVVKEIGKQLDETKWNSVAVVEEAYPELEDWFYRIHYDSEEETWTLTLEERKEDD